MQNSNIPLINNNSNNLLQYLNSSQRERNQINQENSSSNQNDNLNIGQFINNPRLIPLENNNNNQNNQINIENEINQNNININETGDLFFNGNF